MSVTLVYFSNLSNVYTDSSQAVNITTVTQNVNEKQTDIVIVTRKTLAWDILG